MSLAGDLHRLRHAAQDLRDELEHAFEDLGRAILSAPGRLWGWITRRASERTRPLYPCRACRGWTRRSDRVCARCVREGRTPVR